MGKKYKKSVSQKQENQVEDFEDFGKTALEKNTDSVGHLTHLPRRLPCKPSPLRTPCGPVPEGFPVLAASQGCPQCAPRCGKGGKQGTGMVVYRFTADCREKKSSPTVLWRKCLFVFSSHCTALKFQSSSCVQIQCGFCLSGPLRQQQHQLICAL